MELININPGLRLPLRQPYTITVGNRTFFVTHNLANNKIEWNMFMDDEDLRVYVEKLLIDYLTKQ